MRRLVLTASGGPFRGRSRETLTGSVPQPPQPPHLGQQASGDHQLLDPHQQGARSSSRGSSLLLCPTWPRADHRRRRPPPVDHHPLHGRASPDGATIAQAPPDMPAHRPWDLDLGPSVLTWGPGLVVPNDWREPVSWTFEPLTARPLPAVDLGSAAPWPISHPPGRYPQCRHRAGCRRLPGRRARVAGHRRDRRAAVVGESTRGPSSPSLDDVLAAGDLARTRADELIAARNGGTHREHPLPGLPHSGHRHPHHRDRCLRWPSTSFGHMIPAKKFM